MRGKLLEWSEAAGGTPLVAHSFYLLKIVVEHSRMTNQTHLLFVFLGVGSDDCAAPRANDVAIESRFVQPIISITQHNLPDRSLLARIHTQHNA